MREKIARSIFETWAKAVKSETDWDDFKLMNRRTGYGEAKMIYSTAYDGADAVLDALMEPTPDMMAEGVEPFKTESVRDSSVNGKCGRIFSRMIQAAKDGK